MAFKKVEKEYELSDSSVNCYGFRLLTSGYQIDQYKKNPIGYHMHDRDGGVLLRWEDLTIKGDKVYGKPVINLSHPRGQQTLSEIEDGFLNAASVGHLIALEYSTDPADMEPGQTGPTVTKWFNRECSLVDIPGNFNALTKLFDANENEIKLSDFTNPKLKNMKQFLFTALMLSAMNLTATAEEADVHKAFNDLVAKAAQADKLSKELKDLQDKHCKEAVDALLSSAEKENKITKELSTQLSKDYATNPEGLKTLLAGMSPYKSITTELGASGGANDFGKDLASKSWDELAALDKLEELKAKNLTLFKQKFKEEFGKEYQG